MDPSSASFIPLPRIPKPDPDKDRLPESYWETYKRALSFYKRKWYPRAKHEFLKLLDYKSPHRALYTYLSRTCRKIIAKQMEKRRFRPAYELFGEFFDICGDYITDTDRREYKKLLHQLTKSHPGSDYKRLDLPEPQRGPDFEITQPSQSGVKLLSDTKTEKRRSVRTRNSDFTGGVQGGTVYVMRPYKKGPSEYSGWSVIATDNAGDVEKEFTVGHAIYRFKAAEASDNFVASSDDLVLYLYSVSQGCLGTYDLRRHAHHKYHVRCVDISPEGQFLLFTHVDQAYLLGPSFEIIHNWITPHKEGWEKRTSEEATALSAEYKRSLALLGLAGEPTHEQIKSAFRASVLRHHPDRNPDDPGATERTKELISAYEKLTGEEAKEAFRGLEKAEYYYKMIDEVEMTIPGRSMSYTIQVGMVGPGEDWIYATCLGCHAERIYLGCYSGKVYCLSKDGRVMKLYDCHDVVRSIRETGTFLFIETYYSLYIIRDDSYLANIARWKAGDLRWADHGFMFVKEKELKLFSNEGTPIASLRFKNPIYQVSWGGENLSVSTRSRSYVFSVPAPAGAPTA